MIYYFALCKLNNEIFETTSDADKTSVEIRYFTSQNYNKPEVGILRARPYFSELFFIKILRKIFVGIKSLCKFALPFWGLVLLNVKKKPK